MVFGELSTNSTGCIYLLSTLLYFVINMSIAAVDSEINKSTL